VRNSYAGEGERDERKKKEENEIRIKDQGFENG
jgi:hypothetical protein